MESAVGRANERLRAMVRDAPPPGTDAESALVEWLVDLARPFRTRVLIASHLVFLRRDLLDDELRTKARAHSQLVRRRLCQFLGAMAPDPAREARAVATALEAQWHGLIIQWAIAGQGSLDAWLRGGLTQYLRGLWSNVPAMRRRRRS